MTKALECSARIIKKEDPEEDSDDIPGFQIVSFVKNMVFNILENFIVLIKVINQNKRESLLLI